MREKEPNIYEKSDKEQEDLIKLTKKEFETITGRETNDYEVRNLMKEKGISFNSGDIDIEVEGKKMRMTTKQEDFGTILLEEGYDIIKSGVEKEEE